QSNAKCSSKSTGFACIQKDPHTLHYLKQYPFTETPLLKKVQTPAVGQPADFFKIGSREFSF
ncbi:10713_t:CDS:1, partial [Scutellospora calospora]